jgi:hypothetical protein
MGLTDKVPVDTLIRIRRMPREEAQKLLDAYDLDAEEREQAEKLVAPVTTTLGNPKWDNRLWVVVAFLLGASYRQIAKDKNVSRQTTFAQVTRVLSDEEKKERLNPYISLEAYSEYKVAFFENVDSLRNMTPQEAAMWLFLNVKLDNE